MTQENRVAELLIQHTDWAQFQIQMGNANQIGLSLGSLLQATNTAEIHAAYWQLENHIVVQGTVYSAAVPATRVLVAALADERSVGVRVAILDLLYQILAYDESELGLRCRACAYEGYWIIVRMTLVGPQAAARDILKLLPIDIDIDRWAGPASE